MEYNSLNTSGRSLGSKSQALCAPYRLKTESTTACPTWALTAAAVFSMFMIQFLRSDFVTACPSFSSQHPNPDGRLRFMPSSCSGSFVASEYTGWLEGEVLKGESLSVYNCFRPNPLIFQSFCDIIKYQGLSGCSVQVLWTYKNHLSMRFPTSTYMVLGQIFC